VSQSRVPLRQIESAKDPCSFEARDCLIGLENRARGWLCVSFRHSDARCARPPDPVGTSPTVVGGGGRTGLASTSPDDPVKPTYDLVVTQNVAAKLTPYYYTSQGRTPGFSRGVSCQNGPF
jgi:hypothetical protein